MKIVTVIPTLTSGGAEKVCLRLHQLMLDAGIESHLVVLSQQAHYRADDFPNLHFLPLDTPKNIDFFVKRRRATALLQQVCDEIARSAPIDAIFSHLDESHLLVAALQTDAARHYVVHTSVVEELRASRRGLFKHRRLLRKKKVLQGRSVIAVSAGLADEIRSLDWLRPSQVTTILNPLDAEQVAREARQQDQQVELNDDFILHIGRFARAKRHDVLFDAFAQLQQRHPALKLVLLTRVSSKLKKQLRRRNLEHSVITPGLVQNPYPWIRQAKLLVLSSDFEGFPNVLNEALMCETPFVSTDCPHGPREILADFHPEWLVPRNSPTQLADKIGQLLQRPPQVDLQRWPLLDKVRPDAVVAEYIKLAAGGQA